MNDYDDAMCITELRKEIERLRKQRDLLRRTIQVFRGEVYRSAEAAEKRAFAEIGGEDGEL
jgi:hypothetical protein